MAKKQPSFNYQLGGIPANAKGRRFLRDLREYANRGKYRLVVRNNGPHEQKHGPGSVRLENATGHRVYFYPSEAEQQREWDRNQENRRFWTRDAENHAAIAIVDRDRAVAIADQCREDEAAATTRALVASECHNDAEVERVKWHDLAQTWRKKFDYWQKIAGERLVAIAEQQEKIEHRERRIRQLAAFAAVGWVLVAAAIVAGVVGGI
jgi:hypothetical protein